MGWVTRIAALKSLDDVVKERLLLLSKINKGQEALFFKYQPNHRSVVATFSVINDLTKYKGLGVHLTEEETPLSITEMLNHPEQIPSLSVLLKKLFLKKDSMEKKFKSVEILSGL